MVRRLVGLLLGERNAVNLYKEDNSAQQFEDDAKKAGVTVIACDLNARSYSYPEGVIDPLAYTEQEQAQEHKQNFGRKVSKSNGCGHSNASPGGESLPPLVYLKPGEQITHMWRKVLNPVEDGKMITQVIDKQENKNVTAP